MSETMTLIAGRSSKQGTSLNAGKLTDEYRQITTLVEMNSDDMAHLGLQNGDKVRLQTEVGQVIVRCQERQAKDLPAGLLFMAYGPPTSQLMGADTAGSGMPISKNFEVEVEPLSDVGQS